VDVLLVIELTPMMYFPSGVRCSFPLNSVVGRACNCESVGGVAGAGGKGTARTWLAFV
jgi:hypothetical protein